MNVIIHPTWACQFNCAYCSVHAQGLEKNTKTMPVSRWLWWIRLLPDGSHVEISGGEPLLYGGIILLLQSIAGRGFTWGITTNAASEDGVEALAAAKIPGCKVINVSLQPQSVPDTIYRAAALNAAGYRVAINHVIHPASPDAPEGAPTNNIPYQAWLEGEATDGITRTCNAGINHMCCDPQGRVYRCLVDLQLGEQPIGTIATAPLGLRLDGPRICEHGCTTCYTDDPRAWGVQWQLV